MKAKALASILAVCFLMSWSMPAEAQTNPGFWNKYNGTYDTGRNYLKGLERGSGAVATQTGAWGYTWQLPLPPGRRGMEPKVGLVYSSKGGRGAMGEGWKWAVPHIERDTNFGPPTYDNDTDLFVFFDENGASHPLVPVYSGLNEKRFRALRESDFALYRFFPASNTWQIRRQNGDVLQVTNPLDSENARVMIGGLTMAWYVTSHKDSAGNSVEYNYSEQGHLRVPNQISYSKHLSTGSLIPVRVTFAWVNNPDKRVISCAFGACLDASGNTLYDDALTLDYVKVEVRDASGVYRQRRRFSFAEVFDEVDAHRVLTKLTQLAYDAAGGNPQAIPDVEFAYQPSMLTDEYGHKWLGSNPSPTVIIPSTDVPSTPEYTVNEWDGSGSGAWYSLTPRVLVDINGDGIKDLVERYEYLPNVDDYQVYLGQIDEFGTWELDYDTVFWEASHLWCAGYEGYPRVAKQGLTNGQISSNETIQDLIDMNGDGRPDFVCSAGSSYTVALNNGSGFDSLQQWPLGVSPAIRFSTTTYAPYTNIRTERTTGALLDFNGDGLPDQVWSGGFCPNNGVGFDECQYTWFPGDIEYRKQIGINHERSHGLNELVDMNGDGLPDMVVNPNEDDPWHTEIEVYLNTGNGFYRVAKHWGLQAPLSSTWDDGAGKDPPPDVRKEWSEAMLFDFNGDGLTDYYNGGWLYQNTGSVFLAGVRFRAPALGYSLTYELGGNQVTETHDKLIDLNGDGRPDAVVADEGPPSGDTVFNPVLSEYLPNFAMTALDNNIGGSTALQYQPISSTAGCQVASPMNVVRSVTTSDALTGAAHSIEYWYENAFFESQALFGAGEPFVYRTPGNREFRGFEWVEEYDVQRQSSTVTHFLQGGYDFGLVAHQENGWEATDNTFSALIPTGCPPMPRLDVPGANWPQPTMMYKSFVKQTHYGLGGPTVTGKRYERNADHGLVTMENDYGICYEAEPLTCTLMKTGHIVRTTDYKSNKALGSGHWIVARKQEVVERFNTNTTKIVEGKEQFFHDGYTSLDDITTGLLTKIKRWHSSGAEDYGESNRTYDARGLMLSETDWDRDDPVTTDYTYETTWYTYLASKVVADLGEHYTWDAGLGQKTMVIDFNGVKRRTTYDNFGRPLVEEWSDYSPEEWHWVASHSYYDFEFQTNGTPIWEESYGNIDGGLSGVFSLSERWYNGLGQLLQESANHDGINGTVRSIRYDPAGRLEFVYNPVFLSPYTSALQYYPSPLTSDRTEYDYDSIDRVVGVKRPCAGGASRAFAYGGDLSVVMTDEEGKKLRTAADGWGNIDQVIRDPDGLAETTSFDQNSAGQIIGVTDPENRVFSYARDYQGNITRVTLPGSQQWNYGFDRDNRMTYSLSPVGRRVDLLFDVHGRVVHKGFTNPTGEVTFVYDGSDHYANGRLWYATSEAGTVTYDYDQDGRVLSRQDHREGYLPPEIRDYTLGFTYTDGGLLKTLTYPDGYQVQYSYNYDRSPKELRQVSGDVLLAEAGYDALGQLGSLANAEGLVTEFSHDTCGQLTRIHAAAGADIMDRVLFYNANGQLHEAEDNEDVEARLKHVYLYDGLKRLSAWQTDLGASREAYDFTSGGAQTIRLQRVTGELADLTFSYGSSQLPWAPTQVVDALAGTTTNLVYDADGLLTSRTVGATTNTFSYTASAQLAKAQVTRFNYKSWLYDHEDRAAHSRQYYNVRPLFWDTHTDFVGDYYETAYTDNFSKKYLFLAGKRLGWLENDGDLRYVHADERGSVRYVTDPQGEVLETYHYRPYGSVVDPGLLDGGLDGDTWSADGSADDSAGGGETDGLVLPFSKHKFNDRRDEGYGLLRWPLRNLGPATYHWTVFDRAVLQNPGILMTDGANPFAYCGYEPVGGRDATGAFDGMKVFMRARGMFKPGPDAMQRWNIKEDDPDKKKAIRDAIDELKDVPGIGPIVELFEGDEFNMDVALGDKAEINPSGDKKFKMTVSEKHHKGLTIKQQIGVEVAHFILPSLGGVFHLANENNTNLGKAAHNFATELGRAFLGLQSQQLSYLGVWNPTIMLNQANRLSEGGKDNPHWWLSPASFYVDTGLDLQARQSGGWTY